MLLRNFIELRKRLSKSEIREVGEKAILRYFNRDFYPSFGGATRLKINSERKCAERRARNLPQETARCPSLRHTKRKKNEEREEESMKLALCFVVLLFCMLSVNASTNYYLPLSLTVCNDEGCGTYLNKHAF